jgi:3-mercaptopyruvate sulfurtransferase SseA
MKRFLMGVLLLLSVLSLSLTQAVLPAWADVDQAAAEATESFLSTLPDDYWSIKEIDQLKALLENDRAQLIDVREPGEYAAGHIEGAVNIPLRLLAVHQPFLPDDRPLILYCSSGYRTAMGVTYIPQVDSEIV